MYQPPTTDRTNPHPHQLAWILAALAAGILLLGLLIGALSGHKNGTGTSKADSDACYAELVAHVHAAPFVVTGPEQQTYYNYCMDLRQGRVPTKRPDF